MKDLLIQIRTKTLFFDIDYKTLLLLYQPILSPECISLYLLMLHIFPFFFYNQQNRYIKYSLLLQILNMKMTDFLIIRKKLEAVNLIKTYLNEEGEKHHCIVLYPPITPKSFFKHIYLSKKINTALCSDDIDFIMGLFRVKKPASLIGTNISATAESLLNLTEALPEEEEHYDELLSRRKKREVIMGWEWLRVLNKQTLKISWTTDAIDYFCNLRYIYNIGDELISKIILNNTIDGNVLDLKGVKREANVHIKRKLKNFSAVGESNDNGFHNKNFNEACRLMRNLSILEFYVYVYKEIPTKTTLTSLTRLRKRYDVEYSIINCLLDFSYIKNNELVISYIDKICMTIVAKNLTSLELVMQHLTNAFLSKRGDWKNNINKSFFTDKDYFSEEHDE